MEFVKKAWGHELIVCNNDKYCGKILKVKEGYQCSIHCHPDKDETFLVMKGVVEMRVGQGTRTLLKYDTAHIRPLVKHQFTALIESEIIEFSTPHDDDDVVRFTKSGKAKPRWEK